MGHTYGYDGLNHEESTLLRRCSESWAFFYANTDSLTFDESRSLDVGLETNLQDPEVTSTARPQSLQHTIPSDNATRAEIQILQQELDERRQTL